MKVILSIFIAFSFLFYSVGFQLFYQMQESANRNEIHTSPHIRATQKITFSSAHYFQLLDDKHEFSFNGKRYDVIAETTHGDSVEVTCYHDTAEEEIAELYNEFIHSFLKGHTSSGKKNVFAKLHVVDYLAVASPFYRYPIFSGCEQMDIEHLPLLSNVSIAIIVPPPQFFV